ncbi:glycine-rich domain-containing protein [Chryseobacterium sp. 2R14A]|uniref:glycine-rich domain-containing protein n=1 Tax=Chryseobacterium sp. 2R14A TaxID=3380353 RepID=UPI003CE74529
METKIVLRNENLWERIQSFSLDSENVAFPFSKKLAKEENWTSDFTAKAIEEYKKFVYLCCILPNGASPSEIVDKVWHMHLIYTQNYWEEFCPNVLQQKLHHHPSNGGLSENEKHKNWFQETIRNYEEIFKQKVPIEIWFNKKEKPIQRKFWFNSLKIFSIILVIFILNSCSDTKSHLLSIIAIPVIFFVIAVVSMASNKNDDPKSKNNGGDSSCGGGGSGCGSSCGGGCGGGCGGCGGG